MTNPARVLLSVPNTGWIHKLVTLAVVGILKDRRHQTTLIVPTWKPYEHAMNRIARDVLDQGYDWWLNIDADNPPVRNPLDLLDLDPRPDMIGCPTPIYHNDGQGWPICWNAMRAVDGGYQEHQPREGLQTVDAIGSGCFLVRADVLRAVQRPWFVRETDADGIVTKGPDFHFSDQVRAAGFRIQAHYDYPCRHFNEVELIEAAQGFQRSGNPSLT